MTQYTIPLSASPSQTFSTSLAGLSCTISLEWRETAGLFLSLTADGATICAGRPCLDRRSIIRRVGTGLPGDLFFQDTQGTDDPQPDGLGARWKLIYDDAG